MNLFNRVRAHIFQFLITLSTIGAVFLLTACPPDPPPDDEVPVTPPHTQPDKPVGATAAPEKQQEPAMSDIRKLS